MEQNGIFHCLCYTFFQGETRQHLLSVFRPIRLGEEGHMLCEHDGDYVRFFFRDPFQD